MANSQIYCLPQKQGWNAYTERDPFLFHFDKQYMQKRSQYPYPRMKFAPPHVTEPTQETSPIGSSTKLFPRLSLSEPLTNQLRYTYNTQYNRSYGSHSVPLFYKQPPPRTHHSHPNCRTFKVSNSHQPPYETVSLKKGTPADDMDRGRHEWRTLVPGPGSGIWKQRRKIPFWEHGSFPKAMNCGPPRLIQSVSLHELDRWKKISDLDAENRLAYGYRRNAPGYSGFTPMSEHVTSELEHKHGENKAMESTAQASYRELPGELYDHREVENANKHKGPLSRMVTITHPFNPFTQQSAFSNMGATCATGTK